MVNKEEIEKLKSELEFATYDIESGKVQTKVILKTDYSLSGPYRVLMTDVHKRDGSEKPVVPFFICFVNPRHWNRCNKNSNYRQQILQAVNS